VIARVYSPSVTHIITSSQQTTQNDEKFRLAKRTLKYMLGILGGKWIVDFEWVEKSQLCGKWLQEKPFEISGDTIYGRTNAPMKGRQQILHKEGGLFSGMLFYLHLPFTSQDPSEQEVQHLINCGGGTISLKLPLLNEASNISLILCSPSLDIQAAKSLSAKSGVRTVSLVWVLDCISF